MANDSGDARRLGEPQSRFATTAWTVVLRTRAGDEAGRLALAELCRAYWYPLYAYLRRTGVKPEDAEDAVQSFLTRLLEGDVIAYADPARGRFRNFLITALKRFLARQQRHEGAARRCPEHPPVSIDAVNGEGRYAHEPCDQRTPETLFEQAWALELIERALQRLHIEWKQSGKGDRFDALKCHLSGQSVGSGRDLARQLGLSESALRVTLHRLKRRYAEILREEVAQTLDSAGDIDDELGRLLLALRS